MLSPRPVDEKLTQLIQILRSTDSPFNDFINRNIDAVQASLLRFGFGAIISGGQTGVDTAAYLIAKEFNIPKSGFAPRGFINESGEIRAEFQWDMLLPNPPFALLQTEEVNDQNRHPPFARTRIYEERTILNAKHSCATLILNAGEDWSKGTFLTFDSACEALGKERVFVVDLTEPLEKQMDNLKWWIIGSPLVLLNIAGPRESANDEFSFSVCERSCEALRLLLE